MEEQKFTLNDAIDSAVSKLEDLDPTSQQYTTAVENLRRVTDVKKAMDDKPRRGPSPDAILGASVTVGMGLLLFFAEKSGLYLGAKPFSWLPKPRI